MLQDIANSAFRPLLGVLFPVHEFFKDGNSRFFWLYVVTGLLLAWLVCRVAHKDERGWSALFARDTWWSASAQNDYVLMVLRPILALSIMSWCIVNVGWVANGVASALISVGVTGQATTMSTVGFALLLTVVLFVVDDFLKWAVHTVFHRVPALWEFHKVHHSAEVLNFTTSERFHPVEAFVTGAVVALGLGTVNGIFIALLGHKLTPMTVAGANIFLFTANIFGGVLRHSPCWLAFPPAIERWIISPAMHQIHHSSAQRHWDTNMGVTLSIWDRMAGTLLIAKGEKVEAFGIGEETPEWRSMTTILVRPFTASFGLIRASISRRMTAGRPRKPVEHH
jgi:sterol desaturase/sphingolipid hydroxylase (fatty acid hydroxylase superfamily)